MTALDTPHPRPILTSRLRLVPVTTELARAELQDPAAFAIAVDADVPDNWPPDTLTDALPVFLDLLAQHPDWSGWLCWYAVAVQDSRDVLVGSVGFRGPPDANGVVETGYSVLPQHRRSGYAVEMAVALLAWARAHGARDIIAQTTDDNAGSRGVLSRLGFVADGPGEEPEHTRYRLAFAAADAARR